MEGCRFQISEDEVRGAAQSLAWALLLFVPSKYGPTEYDASTIFDQVKKKLGTYRTRKVSAEFLQHQFSLHHLKIALAMGGKVKKFIKSASFGSVNSCRNFKQTAIIKGPFDQGLQFPVSTFTEALAPANEKPKNYHSLNQQLME